MSLLYAIFFFYVNIIPFQVMLQMISLKYYWKIPITKQNNMKFNLLSKNTLHIKTNSSEKEIDISIKCKYL